VHHAPTDTTFDGQVTCLFVDGDRASVGGWVGTVIRSGTPPKAGDAFLVFFADGGDAIGGRSGIDLANTRTFSPGMPPRSRSRPTSRRHVPTR
jgi:hypothetical protein